METNGKQKTAAILTINNAPDMDLAGRKRVAHELRHQINMFVQYGGVAYSKRFCYRYLYREGDYAPQKGHK
jgi:hypothetical protein